MYIYFSLPFQVSTFENTDPVDREVYWRRGLMISHLHHMLGPDAIRVWISTLRQPCPEQEEDNKEDDNKEEGGPRKKKH